MERSIYYLDNDNKVGNIVFEYENEEEFKNIMKDLHSHIDVVATFGTKENICYTVFENIAKLYSVLLLDKTTSIYIINRKDVSIKLSKRDNVEKQRIAVIKLDAVLAEYHPRPYFLYSFFFLLGGLVTIPIVKNFS